ncbi:MAG: hypothetical protein K5656_09600 [Lachnospiraceae bacterium]|nr:hypothetical protein [Lachnospiraceae bacterium]
MESNKELFFKDILERNLKEKDIDNLINDLLREIEDIDSSEKDYNYIDLLFLLYLDEISQKLYCKSEDDEVLPLVEKEKYSNNKGTGYFDLLFKAASILIFKLLNKNNWNVILKMDVHNCPLGPSLFSLVSCIDSKPHFSFKKNDNSKAYALFFLYNLFCKDKVKSREIKKEEVYTVHKEFSDIKAIRSISYQYNKSKELLRYFDGEENGRLVILRKRGEQLYLDFLSCVLDENFITRDTSFSNYVKKKQIGNGSSFSIPWSTAKSFSFFNLGVSGFESWGTLMIEAFESKDQDNLVCNAKEVNDCFYHKSIGNEEREDGRELGKIKSIISALKKVDDEYNDALNKQNIKKESIKSAISAIMSRNMSHNLGSHYMYYTKAHLEALADKSDGIAPDIRGAAKVLGYIQGRMDYLATIISNDRFPYGAVNFKSQIFDELTIDDFSHRHFPNDENKRTTNFLLTNLIQSENFTRSDVRSDERDVESGKLYLYVKFSSDGEKYRDFTGTWHSNTINWIRKENQNCTGAIRTMDDEQDVKTELSLLNIALPGGSMSCHAFFNLVENFIRNSAKYLKDDIPNEWGLVCTIAIKPNNKNSNLIDLIIYDNKGNGNTSLYDELINKLKTLNIIDKDNQISKENKGFKEMLFSSVWMNAYTFEGKTCGDIIADINQAEVGENKLELIKKYGFSLVKVHTGESGRITVYDETMDCKVKCNLGIKIKLPVFKQSQTFNLSGDETTDVNAMLNMMSDVVLVNEDFKQSDFREVFTRPLVVPEGKSLTILEQYKEAIKKRFPQIEDYYITFDDEETEIEEDKKIEEESNSIDINIESRDDQENNDKYCIYFKRHADTSGKDPSFFRKYAYADTISGGNFTITLSELYQNSIGAVDEHNKTADIDEIFALKIKESALTRITIIDERLFNSAKRSDYPWLSLKNIRVLNIKDCDEVPQSDNLSLSPIFEGNSFMDNSDKTHFLSIHLGLLEKILKDSKYVNAVISRYLKDSANEYTLSEKRVKAFMDLLNKQFGYVGTDNATHFAIHSGRGNYSHELDVSLMKYPFITLSALESVYNNSKYLLAQLFYNTVYIGKGYAKRTKKD